MDLITPGIYTSLQLFVIISIGFIIRRLNIVREGFQQVMSSFLVKIALPVYFFSKFATTDMAVLKQGAVLLPVGALLVGTGLLAGWLVFLVLPFRGAERRAGVALAGFGNSGYMPLAIIEILPFSIPFLAERYDLATASLLVGVVLVTNSPLLWSVGNSLVARHGQAFRLTHLVSPPSVGIFLGLLIPLFRLQPILADRELPFFSIHAALDRLGTVILPLILINLGVMIASIKLHHTRALRLGLMTLGVMCVRFVFFPVLFFVLYRFFLKDLKVHPVLLLVLFLETHTPPATNLSAMAAEAGVNEDLTAFTLLISYLAYIVLLPLYLVFFIKGVAL